MYGIKLDGGKLQMQINLDSLVGKLDFHFHEYQLMINSGISVKTLLQSLE
jgi:hypothetical protein